MLLLNYQEMCSCWSSSHPYYTHKILCRFFVPTDSAGSHAKVQGTLAVNTVPAERVAHLESEGGKFPNKNPDGSANELRLVATGVELSR